MQVNYASCGTHLIPRAFPSLHSLTLTRTRLDDGSLFSQLADQPACSLTSLHLGTCSIDSAAVQQVAIALAKLPGMQALRLDEGISPALATQGLPDSLVPIAAHLTALTRLTISSTEAVLNEQQLALVMQNQGLRSLSLVNRELPLRRLQPNLLRQVLTSCTALTQLTLTCRRVDDQGLGVLLTHGTSITDLTLGTASLKTSKADRACSWRKLVLHRGTLQEYAYLPLKSVQQLQRVEDGDQATLGKFALPHDTPAAQLPDLLHQATTNLASCPAWTSAPPSELQLVGSPQDLTSAQRVQLLQALAPVAGRHVSKLVLHVKMELGPAEVEAIASNFAGSLTSLHLDLVTLHDSFWRPLTQHFHSLQELWLGNNIKANVISVVKCLRTWRPSQMLTASITCFKEVDAARLRSFVDTRRLENIHLNVEALPDITGGYGWYQQGHWRHAQLLTTRYVAGDHAD
jgi:hypothetical protein